MPDPSVRWTPLIGLDARQLRAQAKNPIIHTFRRAFDETFAEQILPAVPNQGTFPPASAPLYVAEREWLLDWPAEVTHFPYEDYLDKVFWEAAEPVLIMIQGEVGCGKSTFVDYYQRCYGPHSGRHAAEFPSQLLIVVDLRSLPSTEAFDEYFYHEVRHHIVSAFDTHALDIESLDNFAMWEPVFRFGSPTSKMAQGNEHTTRFRARMVMQRRAQMQDKRWVDLAFQLISNKSCQAPTTPLPFRSLVVTLDNIDQSTFEVQAHALRVVKQWIQSRQSAVRRVLLPLRPETLSVIRDAIAPLPPHNLMRLGRPDAARLYETRNQGIQSAIAAHGGDVDLTDEHGAKKPLSNDACRKFLGKCYDDASPKFISLVRKLSGRSVRRELELWEWALSSRALFENYFQHPAEFLATPHVSSYVLLDAILTGKYEVHHCGENVVVNLFYLLPEVYNERDLLIGPHILYLINAGFRSSQEVFNKLQLLGYQGDRIGQALDALRSKHFFEPTSSSPPRPFVVQYDLVAAHLALLHEAAYADNVAMVTPLPPAVLTGMRLTSSYKRDDFLKRVATTFQFLMQLQRSELRFCQASALNSGVSHERFAEELKALSLPSLFKQMTEAYRERLVSLNELHYLSGVVSDGQWKGLFSHEVFQQADSAEDMLVPILVREAGSERG